MDLVLQPYLENELVKLRPLELTDFSELYKVGSDPLLWQQHQNKDRYIMDNFKVFFEDAINSKGALAILDAKNGKLIGSSRFKIIEDNDGGVVEIGWSFLSRDYWGGIYNRAFKKLMVDHALKSVENVILYVNPKNTRSQKALEKLGARKMVSNEKTWVLPQNEGFTYLIDSYFV